MSISSSISCAAPTMLSHTITSCRSCCCKPSAVLSSPSAKTVSVFASRVRYSSSRGGGGVGRDRQRNRVRCNSSSKSPESGSGDNDSKTVLDAFFLGKAFAEALNERIESTVGEILSVVGQWQAEQQKQVLDFQEEVIVRAKKAKEKAALQVMEEQIVPSKSLSETSNGATPISSSSLGSDADNPLEKMSES